MESIPKFDLKISLKKPAKPAWLETLLASKFFEPCETHIEERRNEENIFCTDCACRLCPYCAVQHISSNGSSHSLIQIRRYVHNDVVRVCDINKFLNLFKIQQYTSNGAKVVHLNPKGSSKPNPYGVPKSYVGGTLCLICSRAIAKPNAYCSIACKVSKDYDQNGGLSSQEEEASEENQLEVGGENQIDDSESSNSSVEVSSPSEMIDASCQQNGSFRKRNRKGIPERALLQ